MASKKTTSAAKKSASKSGASRGRGGATKKTTVKITSYTEPDADSPNAVKFSEDEELTFINNSSRGGAEVSDEEIDPELLDQFAEGEEDEDEALAEASPEDEDEYADEEEVDEGYDAEEYDEIEEEDFDEEEYDEGGADEELDDMMEEDAELVGEEDFDEEGFDGDEEVVEEYYEEETLEPEEDFAEEAEEDLAEEDFAEEAEEEHEEKVVRRADVQKNKQEVKKKKMILKIFSILLVAAASGSLGFLIVNISRSNLLPAKYFYPIIAVLAVIIFLLVFITVRRKTRTGTHIVFDVLACILFFGSLYANVKLDDTLGFLAKNLSLEYQTNTFNVLANIASPYNNLEALRGKTIISSHDFTVDDDTLRTAVQEQVGATLEFTDEIFATVRDSILTDANRIILLGSGAYESAVDDDSSYADKTKLLGSIDIRVKVEATDTVNLTAEPFVFYLSGIDTRSGTMPATSLSDVNMAIAVNPNTHQILMVSIPRDYYVQLHGTSGLPDKLTHAGSLGGVQLSMATIEDLLGIKFSEYIRVNFNFVINLVDAIGGITVYSDIAFTSHTDSGCSFNQGSNFVYGRCALAFSRERYAYASGDRHRGENQEQVIEKIFDKISSSSTLISSYSQILNALSGTFETSFSMDEIASLVRFQLDKMPSWNIETQNLDGTTGMTYTYSYPSQPLSVMYQNEETINAARVRLQEVLTAK